MLKLDFTGTSGKVDYVISDKHCLHGGKCRHLKICEEKISEIHIERMLCSFGKEDVSVFDILENRKICPNKLWIQLPESMIG